MALAARPAHPDQSALVPVLQEQLGEVQHGLHVVQPVGCCEQPAVALLGRSRKSLAML